MAVGIIAEYNPFHSGHAWQIREIRRRLGEDTSIVIAMSGNFVQRGDVAIMEKHLRAADAVRGGADLILGLPAAASLSSAEGFAAAGVKLLSATGVVDTLCYGTEIMQKVESIIFDYHIDTIFLHFDEDMHQDHVEANKICLTAARHCANILEYKSNGYILENEYHPTYFVDISDFIEQKKKALRCYGSEHDRMNRLFEMNIERNHIWGYSNEVEYAEGFRVIKMLG